MKKIDKEAIKFPLAIFLVVLCGSLVLFCSSTSILENIFPPLNEPRSVETFPEKGSYNIDANTILEAIDSKQPSIFLPAPEEVSSPNINNAMAWTQPEHVKVANALFEFVWHETPKNWSVHAMAFHTNCKDNYAGFESAYFNFNQSAFQGGDWDYRARVIDIELPDGIVRWGGGSGYPHPLFGDYQYHLDDLKITANDALNIAEENGGRAARQSAQNECTLQVALEENWEVNYYDRRARNPDFLFHAVIDPYTGKVIESR